MFIVKNNKLKINQEYKDEIIDYFVKNGVDKIKIQEIDSVLKELEYIYIKYFNFKLDKVVSDICKILYRE